MISTDRMPQGSAWTLGFLLVCVALGPRAASAVDFVVTNSADTGTGSLRQGVLDSNAAPGAPNKITFTGPPANSTIQLASPLANIANELTIDGSAPGGLTLAGNGTTFLTVNAATKLRLTNLTFDAGDLLLGTGANLTYEVTTGTISIDEVIGDASIGAGGILEKTGAGTLILTGANTFSGSALVAGGLLQVSTTSLVADANVASGATLRFLEAPDSTYSGAITGMGAVEKSGIGTLTLTSTNSYMGGTTVTSGTLTGALGPIQGNVLIQPGATLDINDAVDGTYTGTISGSGLLVKSGAGVLTLAPTGNANSWTNARIDLGGLQGSTAAITGDVDIANTGAVLFISEIGSGTVAGDLSGPGRVEKVGGGIITLTGNNTGLTSTAADAIAVNLGRLIGNTTSIPTNVLVDTNATLVLDQTVDGSYANVITGFGSFEKRGGGRVTFNSGQTYAGTTLIQGGRLDVLGGLASSSTSIASGGTLGGTGSLAGSVANSGRIAPGTSIGTLAVDSVSFASGSVLEIEVDASPSSDRLVVTNAAALSGGTLDVRLASGTYTSQMSTILTAGSITGSLSFTDNFPLVDILLQQVGNSLQLSITGNGGMLGPVARSPNQRAVGNALDAETATAGPDLALVIQGFTTLTTREFASALDSLSGESLAQFATARFEHATQFDAAVHSRLRESSDSLDIALRPRRRRGVGLLPDVSAGESHSNSERIDIWFEPYATFAEVEGHQGESDVDYLVIGGALGAEAKPFPDADGLLRNVRVGAAFAYGNSQIDFDDRDADGDAHTYMGALYAGWADRGIRAGLSARFGYSQMESERTIGVGTLVRSAEADFDGIDFGTRAEAGAKWIENDRYLVESYGSIDYTHLERSSFSESGAASVDLRVGREELDSLRVGIGTRVRAIFAMDRDLWLLPEIRVEWTQELLDRDRAIEARFAGATAGPAFTIRGAELQAHSATVGVGWTARYESGFEAGINYDLGLNAERIAHAIGIRVGTHW